MASKRVKSYLTFKPAILAISGIFVLTIFVIFIIKSTENTVKVQSDDNTRTDHEQLPKPSKTPTKPKGKNKDIPLQNDNEKIDSVPSSDPKNDLKNEEYKKSEEIWLKIMKLIEDKDLENIKNMIKLNPELVTGPVFDGKYFIHLACQKGYTDLVMELINLGCNVKIPTKDSIETQPIHLAAMLNSTEILVKLVEKGAEIDVTDINGETPLMYAVISDEPEPVKYLLNNGANPNILVSPKEPSTPHPSVSADPLHVKTILNTAISLDHKEIVKILLDNNADPTLIDSNGLNALNTAAFYGRTDMIDTLLNTGKLDINTVVTGKSELAGKNALDLAYNHVETLEKLKAALIK